MKGFFGHTWEDLHRTNPPALTSMVLGPASGIYRAGVHFRRLAYRRGIFKSRRLPGFVVSLGNVTAGGTGKTPAAVMLAEWATGQGYNVAILSRGYGGSHGEKVLEVADKGGIKADPLKAGDEPCFLANRLPGIPVVVAAQRFHGGMHARERFGSDFFVLDDGFQHHELERDFDIVLLDAMNPFGNGRLLPMGPLREPLDSLARADVIILTRWRRAEEEAPFLKALSGNALPSTPILHSDHVCRHVVFPVLDRTYRPDFLAGKRVVAFAGIARPRVFRGTLEELGAEVVSFRRFEDHYEYKWKDISRMLESVQKHRAEYLLTTEKDWIRLKPHGIDKAEMGYLTIEFTMPEEEAEILFGSISRVLKAGREQE